MAISTGRERVDGSSIMLFSYTASGYKSIAHGTSHTLSISADTEDLNTKDAGVYGLTEVSKLNWSIQADHLYTRDGYDTFFKAMTKKQPVTVLFGLKADAELPPSGTPSDVNISADGNWTANTSYVYSGMAIISSLDWQAAAGSKSTVSVTLNGQGEIKAGQMSNPVAWPTT